MKVKSLFDVILRNVSAKRGVALINVRNVSRTLTGDKVIPLINNKDTLTGRILIYFNTSHEEITKPKCDEINVLTKIKENKEYDLKQLDVENITNLLVLTQDRKYIDNRWDFVKVFNILDIECCHRLEKMEPNKILQILKIYMQIIPNRITEYQFYHLAVNKLNDMAESLSQSELVQFMFYAALPKKDKTAQAMIRKCIKCLNKIMINELTSEELCVICNSAFKTSTKITNKALLDKVCSYLNDNLSIMKDPAIFITLIKSLRHNRYQNDDLLSTIVCTVFFNNTLQYYSFGAMCHILALFADYLYYDKNLLEHFSEKCITELKNSVIKDSKTHMSQYIRQKDLHRFIWTLSMLGYNEIDTDVFKSVIVPKIQERILIGDFCDNPEMLVEILLYLWILNYQALELVPYVFSQKNLAVIADAKPKSKWRLNLLLTAMYFENKPLFKELNIKPDASNKLDKELQMKRRPVLKRVLDNLKAVLHKTELNKFEVNYQVPHLNILGITGYKKNIYKAVHIEVLDDYVCVKNEECRERGLMQLKLRILDGFEEAVILVRHTEIEAITDLELQQHLLHELQLISIL